MEKEASVKQFHPHNHTQSEEVEIFLQSFDKGERGTALRLLDEEKVYIVDAAYIQGMRDRIQHHIKTNASMEEAIQEIRSERDILLNGLFAIYNTLGFIIEAVKEGMTTKKPLRGASVIKNTLKLFGFKEVSREIGNVVVTIIIAIRKNFRKMQDNFPTIGDQILPGLKVLEKHQIISPLDFSNNGEEEE
jgi:hypothetical protein